MFLIYAATKNWSTKRIGARSDRATDLDANQLTKYAKKVLKTKSDDSRFCYAITCGVGELEERYRHPNFHIKLEDGKCRCKNGKGVVSLVNRPLGYLG